LISEDSVSDIHRRWYFTLLNPSSYKTSATISIIASLGIIGLNHISYAHLTELLLHFALGISITVGGFFLDLFLLKGSPTNKISKVIHVAAFSSSLWLVTILLGLLTNLIFSKNTDIINYGLVGMFTASGLRYGIFVSVFGSRMLRSVIISFILPSIFFTNLLSYGLPFIAQSYVNEVIMGSLIFTIGTVWSVLADRAGFPNLKSTFTILQAFLSAWTENKQEKIEEIFESKSRIGTVRTRIIEFEREDKKKVFVVLSDIHPGPFNTVGGSNLPHKLFNFYEKTAIVLHSISDHSLNLPTMSEVNKYLESLNDSVTGNRGSECTLPLQTRSHEFTLTCMSFKTSVVMIISKDSGMEDLPYSIQEKIEEFVKELGFTDIMIVDAHNALGNKISSEEEVAICDLALFSLKKLKDRRHYTYKVGYANSLSSDFKFIELGGAGIGVVNFQIDNKNHFIGWSDSNNLVIGLRERILSELNQQGFNMLDICSSDTHFSSGKRTRLGYYALGKVTSYGDIIRAFKEICQKALTNTAPSTFSFLDSYSQIKLMGKDQFDNYATALNKSMNITKVSLAITTALYIITLIIL
jgi:putative membrane protein